MERFKVMSYWKHLAIDTIITQGVWWVLSMIINTPLLIQSIIAGVVLIATIFAVAWYLPRLSPKLSTTPIRDWIDISAWTVQKQEMPGSLAYKIVLGNAPVLITRQESKPLVVNLLSPLSLASPALSRDDLERLDGQIRIELNRLHIQHRLSDEYLEIIHYVTLDESVTEYTFREKIMDVIRARGSVIEFWKEAIRQAEKLALDKKDSQTE